MRIVVLQDGQTYSDIDKCMVVEFPDILGEQLEDAGDPRYLISQIMAGNVDGRIESIKSLDDSMTRLSETVEKLEKEIGDAFLNSDPGSVGPSDINSGH